MSADQPVTQSRKLVECPGCGQIKKTRGKYYWICKDCGRRWDIDETRYNYGDNSNDVRPGESTEKDAENREKDRADSGDEGGRDPDRVDGSGESGNQPESSGKTLEFG